MTHCRSSLIRLIYFCTTLELVYKRCIRRLGNRCIAGKSKADDMLYVLQKILHYSGVISEESKPGAPKNNNVFRWLLIISMIVYIPLTLVDLAHSAHSLASLSESSNVNIVGWQAVLKCWCIFAHMDDVLIVYDDLRRVQLNAENASLAKRVFYMRCLMSGFSYVYYSITDVIIDGQIAPISIWLPFDGKRSRIVHLLTALYMELLVLVVFSTSVAVENFMSVNLIFLTEHLQQLQQRMVEIGRGEKGVGVAKRDLNECIKSHQNIYRIADKLHPIVSKVILIHFISLSTSAAMTLVLSVKEMSEKNYSNLSAHFFFIVTLVVVGSTNYFLSDRITLQSQKVAIAIFDADWTDWTSDVKSSCNIVIARAQKPIKFTVGGLFEFSLNTYLQMLKNCYSMFTLMYSRI